MRFKSHTHRALVAPLLACCALFLFSAVAHSQQPEGQRRPRGAVAGPTIKLPRGEGASAEQTAGAKEEAARVAAPQKWEYCAITGIVWHQKGFSLSAPQVPAAVVRYFPSTVEEVEGVNEEDAIANAFAKLGEDGWELTGIKSDISLTDGNGKSSTTYFFKRPKRSE
ncbi:MAG TPA: hypothetical protein VEX60_12285 [Pyrinomonadaceae bacterium]|nr:hypothetical protein [Pyrinomonadaceae bacterium]